MLDKMNAAICSSCEAAVPVAEMNKHGECDECAQRCQHSPTGKHIATMSGGNCQFCYTDYFEVEDEMSDHKTPTEPGYYWAKLVHPRKQPESEDWVSSAFEVACVYENYGEGDDEFRVHFPGIEPSQLLNACEWGPRVPDFDKALGGKDA